MESVRAVLGWPPGAAAQEMVGCVGSAGGTTITATPAAPPPTRPATLTWIGVVVLVEPAGPVRTVPMAGEMRLSCICMMPIPVPGLVC